MSKQILGDVFIYLPAKLLPAIIGILTIPVLTHLLSPVEYGKYVLGATSLSLISVVCISGLVSIVLRFNIVNGTKNLHEFIKPLLLISLTAGFLIWVSSVRFWSGPANDTLFVTVGVIWLIAQAFYEYFLGWSRARNLAKIYSIAVSWRSIGGFLLAIIFLSFEPKSGVVVFLATAIIMLTGLTILPHFALRLNDNADSENYSKCDKKLLFRYGISAAIVNVVLLALSSADRFIIGILMDAESVAIYGANYDLAEKPIFFINSLLLLSSSVIGIRIFEQEGEINAASFLTKLIRFYLLVAPPLAMTLAVLSDLIVELFLPKFYIAGAVVLPFVAIGGIFVGIMHRYSLLLSFHKRTDTIIICSVGALCVNLFACWVLIPQMGLVGAAISTSIAYLALLFFVRMAALKYHCPRFPWITFWRVIASIAIAATAMIAMLHNLIWSRPIVLAFSFCSGMIIYTACLYFLKEFSTQDIRSFNKRIAGRLHKL